MSQMNKERELKPKEKPKNPQPTAADLQALQDAGVDYTDIIKIFFKCKDNDK